MTNAASLAANFFMGNRASVAFGICMLGIFITFLLFLPEIKRLRLVVPRGVSTESAGWLLVFGLALILMAIVSGFNVYQQSKQRPEALTDAEFSHPMIHGKYLRIADFADSHNVIEGRTFVDSYIYGPAVLLLHDRVDVYDNAMEGSPEGALILASPSSKAGEGSGIIVLKEVKFSKCHFVNITFITGSQQQYDQLRTGFGLAPAKAVQ